MPCHPARVGKHAGHSRRGPCAAAKEPSATLDTRKTGRPPGLPKSKRLPAPLESFARSVAELRTDARSAPRACARVAVPGLPRPESRRERLTKALAMALQADPIKLRESVRERLGAHTFESYLDELHVVEVSADRVVLRVGATLALEAFRRCGPALADASRQLFGSRRVLLAGDGEWFDLGEGRVCRGGSLAGEGSTRDTGRPRPPRRLRQRSGPCGQPGTRQRLEAQKCFGCRSRSHPACRGPPARRSAATARMSRSSTWVAGARR